MYEPLYPTSSVNLNKDKQKKSTALSIIIKLLKTKDKTLKVAKWGRTLHTGEQQ